MKYIKNTLDYSVTFKLKKGALEEAFEFDCFRIYQDTGNVATTGVTPIAEKNYDALYKENRPFKDFIDTGKLVSVKKSEANTTTGKIDDLSKENEALKAELAEAKKALGTGESEESKKLKEDNKAKDEEIASLKEQLEAVKKGKADKKDETEGF